jgi:hypothetical protein
MTTPIEPVEPVRFQPVQVHKETWRALRRIAAVTDERLAMLVTRLVEAEHVRVFGKDFKGSNDRA